MPARTSRWLFMAATMLVLAGTAGSAENAQTGAAVAMTERNYVGLIDLGAQKLRVALHLHLGPDGLTGNADSPDQDLYGLKLADIRDEHGRLSFGVPQVRGRFAGQWDEATGQFSGKWTQAGKDFSTVLKPGGYPAPLSPAQEGPASMDMAFTSAPARVATTGTAFRVGQCINLSNMFEAPSEGAWGPGFRDSDAVILREAGFETVRLPVGWSFHAGTQPPYRIDPAFLRRIHQVVDEVSKNGLQVILDMHNYPELEADPAGQRPRFIELWRQIAESFAQSPASIWFELINEPHGALTNANLGSLYEPALAAIRSTNPDRIVVVAPESNNLDKMLEFALPNDAHIVPSFHYYDPFLFTHQASRWTDPTPPLGRGFGSREDRAELESALAKVKAYVDRTGHVPFVGEYGVSDDRRIPEEQRVGYYGTVSRAFASIGIDSCAWGYRSGFRTREGAKWLAGFVQAISATQGRKDENLALED